LSFSSVCYNITKITESSYKALYIFLRIPTVTRWICACQCGRMFRTSVVKTKQTRF